MNSNEYIIKGESYQMAEMKAITGHPSSTLNYRYSKRPDDTLDNTAWTKRIAKPPPEPIVEVKSKYKFPTYVGKGLTYKIGHRNQVYRLNTCGDWTRSTTPKHRVLSYRKLEAA